MISRDILTFKNFGTALMKLQKRQGRNGDMTKFEIQTGDIYSPPDRASLYTWLERGTVKVKCLAQCARAQSGEERTNHMDPTPRLCTEVRKGFNLHDEEPVHRILWSSLLHSKPLRLTQHWQLSHTQIAPINQILVS